MCLPTTKLLGQNIKGQILDEQRSPLVGASVLVKGTTQGAITDQNGRYNVKALPTDTLMFSFIGYEAQLIPVGDKQEVYIQMVPSETSLDEIVVVGYGQTQNRKVSTNAISTIGSGRIDEIPVSRPEQLLQGNVPGVVVSQNSGSPGTPLTIRLRGVGTAGGAQPLILLDGVQVPDLNFLNSNDIANISLLKDAAAAAIYGARGGNGVVLVQTKKGKRFSQGPEISINGSTGFQNLLRKPELMDRDAYVNYYNEFAAADPNLNEITEAERAQLANTDWYDEVFDSNVPMHNYNISVADGGERYSYYISGGLFDQRGLVGGESGKSRYQRNNLKMNFEVDVLKNVNVFVGADIVDVNRDFLFENQAGTFNAVMNYLPALPSIYPVFDAEGNPYDMGQFGTGMVNGVTLPFSGVGAVTNPMLSLMHTNNNTSSSINMYNLRLNWDIVRNLKFSTTYAIYQDRSFQRNFTQAFDYREAGHNFFNETTDYTEINYQNSFSQWEGNLRYDYVNENGHTFDVMGGFSVLQSIGATQGLAGSDFFVNDFDEANFALIKDASSITQITPSIFETGLFSLYARANYNYKEKFLLSGVIRGDASSRFGTENRTGIFPSFSVGYVLSEDLFPASKVVNLLKVRASYGINGNDNIANYQFSRLLNPNAGPSFGGQNTTGISASFLSNPGVKWEEVSQFNAGIDANLLNNSLGITIDFYDKLTSDMLVPIGTPAYIGLQSAAANVADVRNTGLEFLVTYRKYHSEDFSWNVSFNLGYNRNEVTGLGTNGEPINGGNIGFIFPDPITRTDVGQPIASFYGLQVSGINDSGELIFDDLDSDGEITDADKAFIGKPFPDFTYGANIGFAFKGFDFNTFLYGSQGNDIYDATVRLDAPYASRPLSYASDESPRNLLGGATGTDQTRVSNFYVQDGSFAKLKVLTLGYSFPKTLLGKIKMENLRIYATGQNLFVLTNYGGVDPEIGQAFAETVLDVGIDRGFYPQPRTWLFGFQIKF
ncbi:MAG: SusC/RagA family TonB-linked outer membrane protein [Bacteroidota bacterium]